MACSHDFSRPAWRATKVATTNVTWGWVFRLVSAELFRLSRYWLTWALLVLLVAVLALQVNGRLNDLADLESEVETGLSVANGQALTPAQIEGNRYLIGQLQDDLRYPAFIGYVVRLSTGFGWFLVILFAAVMGGEDFSRQTLRPILLRGVGRARYLLARCVALWLATGVAVAGVTILAAVGGFYTHAQVTDEPIALAGLGGALLAALRAWLTCLPFIAAMIFWAVLARQAGPALGVGLGIHFVEVFLGMVLPLMLLVTTAAGGISLIFRLQAGLLSVTMGYNADVLLHWGATGNIAPAIADAMAQQGGRMIISTNPWRAVAFLAGYSVLHLALAAWILRRRDVTYGS